MRRIRPSEHQKMQWRNGGGVTSEIAIERAGERFLYRLSIADVSTDGPFSKFEGYDRHIVVLEGAGMTLRGDEDATLVPFVPHAFSGDVAVEGKLTAGPVKDLNLIVDRGWASSSLDVLLVREPLRVEADMCMMHVIAGALEEAEAGDTLVDPAVDIRPRGEARIAIARIVRR